jgi:hypothetical protein
MSELDGWMFIALDPRHIRFTPKSGHQLSALECPLCAKSRHSPGYSTAATIFDRRCTDGSTGDVHLQFV